MFSIWEGENIEYWGDPPDSWDFYWIHLEGAETKNLLEGWGFARDKLVFRPRDPEAAARLFIQIYSAYYERRESEAYRVVSWLYELGAVCGNSPQPGPPPEDRAHLAGEVLSLIKSSAQPSVNVSQAAAAFGVSRATLFRAFKNAGLRSPVEEIQAARIEKAKQLLASSTLKLSAVADICGFQDTKYFINSFKRITGKSPGAWRGGR
jgi:AraC-like DNA-binding protein